MSDYSGVKGDSQIPEPDRVATFQFFGGPWDGRTVPVRDDQGSVYIHNLGGSLLGATRFERILPDQIGRVVSGAHRYERIGDEYQWRGYTGREASDAGPATA